MVVEDNGTKDICIYNYIRAEIKWNQVNGWFGGNGQIIGGEKVPGFYISFAVAEGSALFLDLPITNIITRYYCT
jgi:hypothetical protein